MQDQHGRRFPWEPCSSELVGTAVLVLVGLSLVMLMFGADSPLVRVVPNAGG
jgi:aquaporin Z